ncbi:putative F-box protein At1g67623 [Chenopodium quinoa]|uniref:putative F-box protein At1g67623 n=1 Tax=Chenopodium quinoa TaxID=63459 RepID=UPI000B77C6A9|nr:putative F-box protein At1g67623 [Chenopodium quinoa]
MKCVENEHPEALFEFGFRQYFNYMVVDQGLKRLERATALQNTEATYIVSLIYIYTGEEEKGVKLLENTINSIGSAGIVQCRRKLRDMEKSNWMRNNFVVDYMPQPHLFCKQKLQHEKNLSAWAGLYDENAENTISCLTCKCVREINVFYTIVKGLLIRHV